MKYQFPSVPQKNRKKKKTKSLEPYDYMKYQSPQVHLLHIKYK
jgi:hypothetical protein